MRRRFLLRSLALAGLLLACFVHLLWNGSRATTIVAENLPHPPLSSGKRDIDLWHPTASFGRVYDLTFAWPEEKPWTVPDGSRLQVQLVSNGRARPVVVRPGHPNDSVSWWAVLRGRERLQIVADRGWVDLGPFPASGTRLDLQILGLLPGEFGFAEQDQPGTAHFSGFHLRRPDSPRARPTRTIVRYRFVLRQAVAPPETLARFFFFLSCSRVLLLTGAAALTLLVAGWAWLWEGRVTRAVAALIPAVTLIHACCLPPFQGADEVAHQATIEALLFSPSSSKGPPAFPAALSRVYAAIGYDRFAGDPETPIDLAGRDRRAALASVLESRTGGEAPVPAKPMAEERVLDPSTRASLYYNSFRALGPLVGTLSVLDRLASYVVASAAASLLFFGAGLYLLSRFSAAPLLQLSYGLVALLPYSVGVVGTCSNYSPAIGLGQFLAACLVAGVLTDSLRRRLLATGLFTFASLVGIGVWDDFVFFAVPATAVLTLLTAWAATRLPPGRRRRIATTGMLLLGLLLTAAVGFALATGRIRNAISSFGARLPKDLGRFEDPSFWLLLGIAAAPFVVALVLALAVVRSHGSSENARRRGASARSAALAAVFAGMFFVTRWRAVPFENLRLDYPDEVAAHWGSFWSNNFSFDQDVLFWKMYWGVFGYADVSFPDAIYAGARWACVALFLALPILSWRFTQQNRARSALLLVAAGYGASACVVTNSLRFFMPTNPWGRFILPAVPLVALPLLARITDPPARVAALRVLLAAFVALHLWTAVALLGSRYAFGL